VSEQTHNTADRTQAVALTTGTFDGVHAGHLALVQRARTLAGPRGRVVALVFDPSPAVVLHPGAVPARLTTFAQRDRLLRDAGVDEVVRLNPTPEFLSQSAEDFVASVVSVHRPSAWVEGPDFRFGKGRRGDTEMLRRLSSVHGFTVAVVDPVEVALTDQTLVPARSTMVRWLLAHGRVRDAALVLGREYVMDGTVVGGATRRRATGGTPRHKDSPCSPPAPGVYAGRARLPDGRVLGAAVSVGTKPTFSGSGLTVEAFLLDPSRPRSEPAGNGPDAWRPIDGLPEYGWAVELSLVAWIRGQIKFDGLPGLLRQMARDCAMIESILSPSGLRARGAAEVLHDGAPA
jgi:riboflavin kinase / FMN adenylyltransferase